MYKNKRILAVIPARGGSKGIPRKNLRHVGDVPLVGLAGMVAARVPVIDRAVVSTDDDEIATVAEAYGLDAPFRRPEHLSGDAVGDIEVLEHALKATEGEDASKFDIVVMLQPTSPLRQEATVSEVIEKLVNQDLDSVWTVSETDSKNHPLKQLMIIDGQLDYYDAQGKEIIARQQLEPVYHRNGVAYALTRECLLKQGSLMGRRTGAVVQEGLIVSIDTEWDIEMTELIRRRCS